MAMEHGALVLWMKRQMERRGWSGSDLARAVGVDSSVVSRWLRTRQPDPASVGKIAFALGGDIDELLTMAGHRTKPALDGAEGDRLHLIALIRQVHLTPERSALLIDLLDGMRRRDDGSPPEDERTRAARAGQIALFDAEPR